MSIDENCVVEMTSDGRISASTAYAQLAVLRLCRTGVEACELRLLCTRCGVNQTMTMNSVSREKSGETDDREMQKLLRFKSMGGNKEQIMMPQIIVIDAVSILRASQRQAVMPGVGLNSPIRPIQGPVCTECCAKSMMKHNAVEISVGDVLSDANDIYHADDETDDDSANSRKARSSLPSSPKKVDFSTTSDFTSRHDDLLKNIAALTISSPDRDLADVDLRMNEACDCGYSINWTCGNTRQTALKKNGQVTKDSRFALVFGHVSNEVHQESTRQIDETIYEICIMDTRHQRMCHIANDNHVKAGLSGQYQYFNAFRACGLPVVTIPARFVGTANVVNASNANVVNASTADLVDASTADVVNASTPIAAASQGAPPGAGSVFMATCIPHEEPIPKGLIPPPNTSCFVCCSLLDEDDASAESHLHRSNYNRPRHTNVYLESHSNWAHKDCTVSCEKQRLGVCKGICPRLNTFVSTQFDQTPRFENICAPCMAPTFTSAISSSNTDKHSHKEPTQRTNRPKGSSPKRQSDDNWLAEAGTMRKKAALNLAKQKMTQKERDATEVFVFPTDKSGIYNDKVSNTWYSLDKEGLNPQPVCDLPFWDSYFDEKRTWATLGEREQAITSHKCLLEMFEM